MNAFSFSLPSALRAEGREGEMPEIDRAHALSCIMSPPSGLKKGKVKSKKWTKEKRKI